MDRTGRNQLESSLWRGEKIKQMKKVTPIARAMEPEMLVSTHRAKY